MNPSKPRQASQEELHSNGPNEQRTATQRSIMDAVGDSGIDSLPNEVMLSIFRFLNVDQLLIAEQVCLDWKAIVNTCFATTTTVHLSVILELCDLEKMKRYGSSVKSLKLEFCVDDEARIDWMNKIVNTFPKLQSLSLIDVPIRSESLRDLPVKCCQITRITLNNCCLSDEDLGIVLKGFPGLKYLELSCFDGLDECFRELGSKVEQLILTIVEVSQAGTYHIFSRCTNLQSLRIGFGFECDAHNFSEFCKKASLRKLSINRLELSEEAFLPISRLSLLERLVLTECPAVDSDVLMEISIGCPNLIYVELSCLPLVCDRGIKSFAQCKRLTHFYWCHMKTVTDESLIEIAKAGVLVKLGIYNCVITDRGLSAILAQCPHLRCLCVKQCSGVGDSTVDAAIAAVETRARCLRATRNQESPHGESNLTIPRVEAIKIGDHLLTLRLPGERLNQYKDGSSHPFLKLELH